MIEPHMKTFYIETDRLTQATRTLRYVFSETSDDDISFIKVVDPETNEVFTAEEMKKDSSPDLFLSIATAYRGNYKRVYF